MNFEKELQIILKRQVGLTDAIRRNLITEILRAHEIAKNPVGRKEGVTFMTPDASIAADKIRSGEIESDPEMDKPKSV